MEKRFRRGLIWSVVCASALLLAFATARTAQAANRIIEAEGGTTDDNGDTGHMAIAGGITVTGDNVVKSLAIAISYQDNDTDGFVCLLGNPGDLVIGGGKATLTVTAGDACAEMGDPTHTFSNTGNSITFKFNSLGSRGVIVSTASTLRDFFGDDITNVAISGELDNSGGGSNQATGPRLIEAGGGAVDTDDGGHPSGHMAIAGSIQLNSITKKAPVGTAKALDLQIEYEDFVFGQHMSCHLAFPTDVSFTVTKGVGILTLTVSAGDACTNNGHSNTGNHITFAFVVSGGKARLISTESTLVDSDGETIRDVAVVGEMSGSGAAQ
jgi:hypothetical protein